MATEQHTAEGILEAVSTTIKENATTEAIDRVKAAFVEREVNKRTDALTKAFDTLQEERKNLAKFKPDNVSYDQDGEEVSVSYSKTKIEERKKLVQKIEKIEKTIGKALSGDFSELYNLGK